MIAKYTSLLCAGRVGGTGFTLIPPVFGPGRKIRAAVRRTVALDIAVAKLWHAPCSVFGQLRFIPCVTGTAPEHA